MGKNLDCFHSQYTPIIGVPSSLKLKIFFLILFCRTKRIQTYSFEPRSRLPNAAIMTNYLFLLSGCFMYMLRSEDVQEQEKGL